MADATPPHSLEAEQSLLGGLMVSNRAWIEVSDQIAGEDFYTRDHQVIFHAIGELLGAARHCDFVTLSEHLRHQDRLDEAGGMTYLATLASDTPSAANVRAYAGVVRKLSIQRGLIAAGQSAAELGYHPDGREPAELLDQVERELTALRNRGARGAQQARAYAEVVQEVENHLNAASVNRASLMGLATGFSELDRLTKGLHPGNLIILGGRPGMGKTGLAMNIAENVASAGSGVAVFSMEMSAEELTQRSISSMAGVSFDAIRDGSLSNDDWDAYGRVSGDIRQMPIWIDETGGLSPLELRARARRLAAKHPLSLIVVDYIQLMTVPGSRENRTNDMSEISRSLKALAKELKLPIIALSQLSRAVEARENKRPRMNDLRESGGIEQDADLILFVYRDEYYDAQSAHKGLAELIVEKQRNGPRGKVWLASRLHLCRFDAAAPPQEIPYQQPKRRGFSATPHWQERESA